MSVDRRARHAVRSLQDSVRRASPAGMGVVARRHRASLVAGLAGALVVVFASISLAAILPADRSGDSANVPPTIPEATTTTPSSVPGGELAQSVHQLNTSSDSPEPYSKFYGTGQPGAVVSAYSPYGTAEARVGAGGEFAFKVRFSGAPVGITFPVTITLGGQEYEFSFTCLWDPAQVAITAHQTYGSSDAGAPYEKFFGTAPPGTAVTATSAYGAAQGVAGAQGTWYLKVWFQEPPAGQPFDVTVVVGVQTFTFPFLWLHEEPDQIELSVSQQGTSSTGPSPYTRFYGTAQPGTHILATSAYGSADVEVGETGEFSFKIWFSAPPAGVKFPITVEVNGEFYATFYFTSYWNPSQTQFTLTQYNTESWDMAPWVKFYGTAQPGTHILATSAYGSADLEVGSSGEYYLKLCFSTLPPAGQPFQVTVKVNGAYYGAYPFTSWFNGVVEVTVNQYNTESWDSSPWVKFYGTAPVGTQIEIISDYGSVSATTTSVNWLLKLWFSSLPPAGQQISVTVKVNGETWGAYPFTSWYQATVEKTAHFTYGSCGANPPYDVYWGTAPAGTEVAITSDYGSGSTTADGAGNWEKQVFFSGAPLNQAFTVTVNVGGVLFYFGMVVTG